MMELGFIAKGGGEEEEDDVPKGLLIRKLGVANWGAWDGGMCGGEGPNWLFPLTATESTRFERCDKCAARMTFILQIYAPIDEIEGAFHRDLCVFFCNSCRLAKCARLQLPRENDFYAKDSVDETEEVSSDVVGRLAVYVESETGVKYDDEEEEDDDDDEDDEGGKSLPAVPSQSPPDSHKCNVCGAPTTTRCSACKSVYYCEYSNVPAPRTTTEGN